MALSSNEQMSGGYVRDLDRRLVVTGADGALASAPVTGSVYDSVTGADVSPLFAFANVATAGTDSALVAAVAGKKIRVLGAVWMAGGTATALTFNSKGAGAGVAISALFANGVNGGAALGFSPTGWFETVEGEALTVTTGAGGSTTGIQIIYVTVE